MLVGVLTGHDIAYYHSLTRLAPIQFIVPPIVWLSSDTEHVSKEAINHINDESSTVLVQLRPKMFRHLYNPGSSLPGYYSAMSPVQDSLVSLRRRLGILEADEPFIPNMMLCHDGMRSQATKTFCRSLADQLLDKVMTFEVFVADPNNPEHATIFENYNSEAQNVFLPSVAYS